MGARPGLQVLRPGQWVKLAESRGWRGLLVQVGLALQAASQELLVWRVFQAFVARPALRERLCHPVVIAVFERSLALQGRQRKQVRLEISCEQPSIRVPDWC
jgi:hypothetical protein